MCWRSIKANYAAEVTAVSEKFRAEGGEVYMSSHTIRHAWSDDLELTAKGVAECWRAVVTGKPWRTRVERYGLDTVRAFEATHGENGWHPHLHVLFLAQKPLTEAEESEFSAWLADRWRTMVGRYIGDAYRPSDARGTDFRLAKADDYIVKIGLEMTDSVGAKRGKGRTPAELLRAAREGDEPAHAAFAEWAKVMRGQKFLTWSKGLKALRKEHEEDQAIEDRERLERSEVIVALTPDAWRAVRDVAGLPARLLYLAELHGTDGVIKAVAEHAGDIEAGNCRGLTLVVRLECEKTS